MSTSKLTSKGQMTIPKDIRTRLTLHPGDRLECVIDEDSRVLVLPASLTAAEKLSLYTKRRWNLSWAPMTK